MSRPAPTIAWPDDEPALMRKLLGWAMAQLDGDCGEHDRLYEAETGDPVPTGGVPLPEYRAWLDRRDAWDRAYTERARQLLGRPDPDAPMREDRTP